MILPEAEYMSENCILDRSPALSHSATRILPIKIDSVVRPEKFRRFPEGESRKAILRGGGYETMSRMAGCSEEVEQNGFQEAPRGDRVG